MNDNLFLTGDNSEYAKSAFTRAVDLGIDFKLQSDVRKEKIDDLISSNFIDPLPQDGKTLEEVQDEFEKRFLPYCYNFASPNFMGFPDAGNSIAAISGNITADFLQQNLINQSFCSPTGTFAEISVISLM